MVPVLYAQNVLDHDHNGLISVKEASEDPVPSFLLGNLTLVLAQYVTTANGTEGRPSAQYDINNDTTNEYKIRCIIEIAKMFEVRNR
ncbi:MAG: hypothetical protein L0H53_13210 [Candidatus Nitrosocosmicus sp.]|nr:hypothetical protein [Candidatus Nitrosocosmicus sp.]MDN5868015.1 hypothetical protein [Candidatus Nitrosocosmicus sp.]